MIAAMTGHETGGMRRRLARRLLTRAGWALLIVLFASRINRPMRIHVLDEPPRLLDQILAQVRLDATSLPDAVNNVSQAAGGQVNLDTADFSAEEMDPTNFPPNPVPRLLQSPPTVPPPLHNVRLETAIAVATLPWTGYDGHLTWREENGAIIVAGKESAAQQPQCRLYDVRDIVREAGAWWTRMPHVPRPPRGLFGMQLSSDDDGSPSARDVAGLIEGVIYPHRWDNVPFNWYAEGWDGWVLVRASPQAHRDIELFLMLLRRGESEAATQIGATQ